jgi:hypothetical protein
MIDLTIARKVSFEEMFNTSTMFYVNADHEAMMETEVTKRVDRMCSDLSSICTSEGLRDYIREEKDSIKYIISLLDISSERFKRIISMIRKDRGFEFSTEWSESSLRTFMLHNEDMMNTICDMFIHGREQEYFINKIPKFYLDSLVIDETTIMKLTDKQAIRSLVKNRLEGTYSNKIGDLIQGEIGEKIKSVCANIGLDYGNEVQSKLLGRSVNFQIKDGNSPVVLMDVSYSVTTSSAQSTKKIAAQDAITKIKRYNEKNCSDLIYINFLDGAGWIGRQADMREIYRCSDYVLNFKTLDMIEAIINRHVI